jgi:ABC-2 type transport system permease protein
VPVALIIPKGFGAQPIAFGPATGAKLRILADSADPVAPQVLAGLVQKVAMTAMPDVMAQRGMEALAGFGGGFTPEQRAGMESGIRNLRGASESPQAGGASGSATVAVEIRDLVGEKKKNPTIAFFAAGLGVMFLLFTAAGAGGALIEEAESGTLDRVLATRVSMTTFLAGKLLYLVVLAVTQLTLMFVWGAVFFGLELRSHLPGFFVMALVSALATSAFGLLLAAICRSRMQLVALSNLVILSMSALGGSMFPRFLMSETMQKFGLVTFNGWALDGYLKVFWRDAPLWQLWPQVLVLVVLAMAFLGVARLLARRWEVA